MSPSSPEDDRPPPLAGTEIDCPRCGCRFGVESLTVRLTGSDRAHEVRFGGLEPDASLARIVEQAQRELVIEALRRAGGQKPRAAELAGMEYETFSELARNLDITMSGSGDDVGD